MFYRLVPLKMFPPHALSLKMATTIQSTCSIREACGDFPGRTCQRGLGALPEGHSQAPIQGTGPTRAQGFRVYRGGEIRGGCFFFFFGLVVVVLAGWMAF